MRNTLQIVLLLTLACAAAHAGVLLTFDQPNQFANPGDLLHFSATIFNNGDDEVILDSAIPTGLSPDFTIIDHFFDNTPPSLPGHTDSGDIDLFDVQVGTPAYGLYSGLYTLYDANASILAQSNFSIQVIPEPGTFTLLALAALLWGSQSWLPPAFSRRRRSA